MSETATEQRPAEKPQEGGGQEQQQTKTFDAEYVEKLRKEAAKYRNEAKSNADAAKRLSEIEDAQKSESEKAADRIAKAEAEVASVPAKVAENLRSHLVELHQIDKDDAELFLTANEPELLLKQVTRLLDRSAQQTDTRRKQSNHVPREGNTPADGGGDPMREFTRGLFNRGE